MGDGGPEANSAVLVVAVANEGPLLNEDAVGDRRLELGNVKLDELPEDCKYVRGMLLPCRKAESGGYWWI